MMKNTEAVGEEVIEVQKMIEVLEGFYKDESSERKPERRRVREQIVLSYDDAALFVFPLSQVHNLCQRSRHLRVFISMFPLSFKKQRKKKRGCFKGDFLNSKTDAARLQDRE